MVLLCWRCDVAVVLLWCGLNCVKVVTYHSQQYIISEQNKQLQYLS